MYILEVIPITALPPQIPQLLSYFFNEELSKGSVVEILIGNRKALAIVVSSESAETQKIRLKKSDFQVKKISKIISKVPVVNDIQFKIALWLSQTYFTSLGLCLKTVLPNFFLQKNFLSGITSKENIINSKSIIPYPLLLSRANDTIKNLEQKIKKYLKNKKQVLIVTPEVSVAKVFYENLETLYQTVLTHSKISVKQHSQTWEKVGSGQAEIIVGTRQALFLPFTNLGLVILEDPANEAYKSDMSPKYNTPELAKKVAEIHSADFLSVTSAPNITEYYLIKNDKIKLENTRPNSNSKSEIKIENMLSEFSSGYFSIFNESLLGNIDRCLKEKKKILVFSTRKGYSTSLICENCRFLFKCSKCSTPLRLHVSPADSLLCYRCASVQKVPDHCPNCNSYKLRSAGFIGSEKIRDELAFRFPNIQIVIFDLHLIKNLKQEEELTAKIKNLESFICISTQAVFGQRYNLKFDLIVVPNLDGLVAVPDYRAEENLFLQIQKLLDFEPQKILARTLNVQNRLIEAVTSGRYENFYEEELKARKIFWYPPFARLVKLSCTSLDKNKAAYEARILSEKLKMAVVQMKFQDQVRLMDPSPAFIEKQKGLYIYNIILKISPDFKIKDILKFVPSNWMIDVEPKSIL